MAENILHDYYEQLPAGVTVLPGKPSSFEVFLNGQLIFSKLATDEFPEDDEVEEKIGALLEP